MSNEIERARAVLAKVAGLSAALEFLRKRAEYIRDNGIGQFGHRAVGSEMLAVVDGALDADDTDEAMGDNP